MDNMSENSNRNGYSNTWMLFESGNGVVVGLSLYSPARQSLRPIDAFIMTEVEGTVTRSARRAAGAVYEAVSRLRKDLRPVVAGFDFACPTPVAGESGGLAFAVALAKMLMQKDPGPVAATGIVQSSHNGGPVKGIRGIEEKLEAAAVVLSSGGWVLYPSENDDEVSPQLRKRLIDEGLRLCPVGSVVEAIDILFESEKQASQEQSEKRAAKSERKSPENKKARRNRIFTPIYILFLFLLLFASATMALWKNKWIDTAPAAVETTVPSETEGHAGDDSAAGEVAEHGNGKGIDPETKDTGTNPLEVAEQENGKGIGGDTAATERSEPEAGPETSPGGETLDVPSEKNPVETAAPSTQAKTGDEQQPEIADGANANAETDETESPVIVDMIGRSRLNSRISQVLETKLKNFFAERKRRIFPEEKIEISGQVVVLRIEEAWEEASQNYRSNLKVAIRDLRYEDEKRTIDRKNIECDIHSEGPVENLISIAAQDLMNQILNSAPSEEKQATDQPLPDPPRFPEKPAREQKTGFE